MLNGLAGGRPACVLIACALCSIGAGTAAQDAGGTGAVAADTDQEARFLFQAGRTAYDAGRYSEALGHFQRAYELSKRPALLYNVGQAADRLRRDEVALRAFEQYVAELPQAANRPAVDERIRVLREAIAEKQAAVAAAEAASAASAAQAASDAERLAEPDPLATDPAPAQDENLLEHWWLWAAAGGVVAGVVIAVLVASGGGSAKQGELTTGSDGKVVVALSVP